MVSAGPTTDVCFTLVRIRRRERIFRLREHVAQAEQGSFGHRDAFLIRKTGRSRTGTRGESPGEREPIDGQVAEPESHTLRPHDRGAWSDAVADPAARYDVPPHHPVP